MSVEELTAQIATLTTDVQARDASIAGLIDAVHTYESTIEGLKAQVADLTNKLAEKDAAISQYKEALIDQIRKLLK